MFVRNLNGDEFPLQATITNGMELNGNQSITSTILATKVNKEFVDDITEMWEIVDFDDVTHKIIYCKKRGEGNSLTVNIKAIPLFFDTFDTLRIYEEYNEHMTAHSAFSKVFADTGFTFVLVDSFSSVPWEGFGGGDTKLETFKRCLERYKSEFRITGNTVYLESLIGRDTQFQYRYRLNASNIEHEADASGYWTYAKGYGNFGEGTSDEGGTGDYRDAKLIREYTSPLAAILDIRHAPPIMDGSVTVAATMDARLKELVDDSLKISVSATIHDLRKQGYEIGQPEVGDRVFLIDERIGLNEEVRVINMSITKDWQGNVLDLSLTFGSESITRRHQSNITTAIGAINGLMSGKVKLPFSALDDRVREISKIINGNNDSVFKYMPNGIMGWNGDNPNYMTRYVGDAIGFSKDGGATYGTAMSAELGIVADYITTGTLRAITIEGVEIYGSKFISEANPTHYTKIENSFLESRGTYVRNWRGTRETEDVRLKLENGQFRARNEDKNWSLYFNDYGLSTFYDGDGGSENNASGIIEFHSKDYSPTGSMTGLSLFSLAGRIALETDVARIYLNTGGSSVFVGDMDDNTFPIVASAFNQSSSAELKRNIKVLQDSGIDVVNSMVIKEWKRLTAGKATIYDKWQAGVLLHEAPIQMIDGMGVDLYTMLAYACKAIQELSAEIDVLKGVS